MTEGMQTVLHPDVAKLRALAEEAAKKGDQALIDCLKRHPEFFKHEELHDIVKQAEEAYDRITAKQTAEAETEQQKTVLTEKKAEQFTPEQTRTNAAWVISRYDGFAETAAAMEVNLNEADGSTAAWVAQTLTKTMKAVRQDGKWIFYGWVRDAMRTQRDNALALVQAKADHLFSVFAENLRQAEAILDEIARVPKGAHSILAQSARKKFDYARNTRFYWWALSAIERMINGSNNPVIDLLRKDPELAEVIAVAPHNRAAMPLIEAMKARVEKRLIALEEKIKARRQAHAQKSAGQRERQLTRSARSAKFLKGGNKSR